MTLPNERTRAVLQTKSFLYRLMDAKETPRVPKSVREEARRLLKHFPSSVDLEVVSRLSNVFAKPWFKK